MTSIVRRRAVGALLLLLVLAMSGAPAVAAPPINHEHPYLQGNYGVHILIDGGEPYSGVACQYVAGRLDRMQIRRPIAFPDWSAQHIGWRYQIEGTNDSDLSTANWHTVVMSSLQKVWARARQAAPFLPRIQHLGGLTYADYRVVVKILWFSPASQVAGRASIAVESYEDANRPTTWRRACPSTAPAAASSSPAVTPAGPPPNPDDKFVRGTHGVNILIDETDPWSFSGATCKYRDDGLGGTIDKIKVRRPIAFPAGRDQFMGWRYVIEYTRNNADPRNGPWMHVATGPLQKVWAVKGQPAPFLPRIFHQVGQPGFGVYRVVVKIFWFDGQTKVEGRSYMAVESYDNEVSSTDPQNPGFEFGCYTALP